nr:hypothetical protein BaRGS_029358 [Batillaria attramentaria]
MSPEDDEEASPRDRKGKKKQDRMDADKAWEEMAEIEEDDSEIEPGGRPGKEDAGGKDGKEEKGGKAGGGKTKGKRTPRGRKGKTAAESSSDTKTDGTAADGKSNLAQTGSQRLPALLEEVVCVNGIPYMLGNYVIISLNLSRNKIGEAGLRSLLSAVQYQSALAREEIDPDTGLLRLCLHKNRVQADNSVLRKIEGVMRSRSVLKGEFESPIAHS